MTINFLKYKKFYLFFSLSLIFLSLISVFVFGLNFGIDFTGGSILEVEYQNSRPANQEIGDKLASLNLGETVIQPTGEKGVIIRMKEASEEKHQEIVSKLKENSELKELRFETIGPVVGRELRQKTIILIVVSFVALLFYVAFAFRQISQLVSPWQYGTISILTISFDVLVTISVFALLGKFYNVQFNIPIVTALLTILGYTMNDKIIIFDRIRENLLKNKKSVDLGSLINQSLNQILSRSLSTGFCTLLVLALIVLFGGETLKYFSLTLIVGIVIGTYSSIFLAPFVLIVWLQWRKKY